MKDVSVFTKLNFDSSDYSGFQSVSSTGCLCRHLPRGASIMILLPAAIPLSDI